MTTSTQRRAAFERFFADLARARSERLGLGFGGTIRRLPPPPLPGEAQGGTRYYLNAIAANGSGPRLVELGATADTALRRAERWVETGEGPAPAGPRPKPPKLKRKV